MRSSPRLVIVGGGIAGAELIRLLSNTDIEISLIEPKHQIECQALYPDYLAGLVGIDDMIAPLDDFCERSGALHISERALELEDGVVVCQRSRVEYDVLVIAVGAEQNFYGVKGSENAFSVNTFEGTLHAREFIERESPDRIMVVGSGLTGVEVASVLADSLESSIYIVEMQNRILPQFPERISRLVERILFERGVSILTSTQVSEIQRESITFADGTTLDCDMTIWTTGIKPTQFVENLRLPKKRGWLLTDPYLRVQDDIFAIGDCAWVEIEQKLATKTGIEAERQAKHMAENLKRMIRRRPLTQYSILACTENPIALISTGCGRAVGVYGRTCVTIPARLLRAVKIWIDKSIVSRYK